MMKNDSLELFWRPIVNQYLFGATALPPYLGLEVADYFSVLSQLGIEDNPSAHQLAARVLRGELMAMRDEECQEVYDLLYQYINSENQSIADEAELMAQVITAGVMASAHLWHDLGLPERPRLSELFAHYFPELSALNNKNMRWKRFLYKQLCENGGDYICRSPSCESCSSFHECFIQDSSENPLALLAKSA